MIYKNNASIGHYACRLFHLKPMFYGLFFLFIASTFIFSNPAISRHNPHNKVQTQADSIYKIAVFSSPNNTTSEGYFLDKPLMDTLSRLGYRVDHLYTTDQCISKGKLNSYHLIIIGRGSRSGDFTDTEFWADIKTPVLCLSGYMVFPDHLNLIGSGNLTGPNGSVDGSDTTHVQDAHIFKDDTAFYNITTNNNQIPYNTWIYDYITYDSASFVSENNGKLLASYTGIPDNAGNGSVVMARWQPGIKTHDNGITHQGYRTYMQMGSDDDASPYSTLNHMQFTPETYQVFKNEISYLIGQNNQQATNGDKPECSDAHIRQIVFNKELVKNPGPSGSTKIDVDLTTEALKKAEIDITTIDADADISKIQFDTANQYLTIEITAGDGATSMEYTIYPEDYEAPEDNDEEPTITGSKNNDGSASPTVFPNPFSSRLNIKFAYPHQYNITIYSDTGRVITRKTTKKNAIQINTEPYTSGLYFVNISYGNQEFVQSVLKD